ncbi:hypothetical protein MSUIS_01890 [Mycoplasma suis KI3806]|uniref:Uncharacterized protein n=1 Tax=Mycoplasma suis (strain KI_3806) TaxID=708248 RepID=F0V360_MYCS3|nr:hypothetical protein [Mycoplasma suis]CBZ40282.1 hypothetical protein MSUIS_01890 [Mycoplasma suis KI3806]
MNKEIDINSNTTIGNLFGELLKNSQTKEIQSQSSRSLKEVQESLGKHNSSFEEVQKSIEEWNKKRKETLKDNQKTKRQVKNEEEMVPPSIDLEKRKALFCFYKKFEELSGKKEGYSKKLKSVEEGNNLEVKIQDFSENSEILESLREIGWDNGDMNDFGKYLRGEKKGKNNKDPLEILLDSEYLQKIRNEAITWKDKTSQFIRGRYLESRTGWSGLRNNRHLSSSLNVFGGKVKSIESEALSLIASKLLEKMLRKVEK